MAKKGLNGGQIALIVIGAIVLLSIFWFIGSYNGLVSADETTNEKWANVQSAYQRRADLIPNLVSTVQGAADFEQETLTQITQLRSEAVAAQTGVKNANTPAAMGSAAGQMESVLGRFLLVMERYPTLTATKNFLTLQDQLEGTENRIKVERDIYNKAVRDYNIKTRRFPTAMIASMFGFDKKDLFEADEGADTAPTVAFT